MSNPDPEKLIDNIVKDNKDLYEKFAGNTEREAKHDIDMIRDLIDSLDEDIIRKLQARQRAVDIIHTIKEEWNMDIKDPIREDQIKDRLIREYPEMQETIEVLYNHIFNQDTI